MIPNPIAQLIATATPPGLGPESREDAWPLEECQLEIDQALKSCGIDPPAANLIRAAILLWHDHLDPSHTISQSIKTPDGSYLHALMHRREPDYPNAKYWLRRSGKHEAFEEISNRSYAILVDSRLSHLANDQWDPFAVVDAVSTVGSDENESALLVRVQEIEFEVLLERFCD